MTSLLCVALPDIKTMPPLLVAPQTDKSVEMCKSTKLSSDPRYYSVGPH